MQHRPKPALTAPQANVGALLAPSGAQQNQQQAKVAFVQENSDFSNSEN